MSDKNASLLAPEVSPLTEADPNSLDDLIGERLNTIQNMKPLDVSDEDLRALIVYYQKGRAKFILESQNKAPRAKPSAKPVPKSQAKSGKVPQSVAEILSNNLKLL